MSQDIQDMCQAIALFVLYSGKLSTCACGRGAVGEYHCNPMCDRCLEAQPQGEFTIWWPCADTVKRLNRLAGL